MRCIAVAALLATLLAGCIKDDQGKLKVSNAVAGVVCGAGGGYIGSLIGGGKGQIAATGAGVLIGAYACNELVNYLEESDLAPWQDAVYEAAAEGKTTSWKNEKTGNRGIITYTGSRNESSAKPLEVLKDRVEIMPPIKAVGAQYRVVKNVNVRSGPGTEYRTVRVPLQSGSSVFVAGRVIGKKWYTIDEVPNAVEKAVTGFVHADYLRPVSKDSVAKESSENPERETIEKETIVETECKSMKQENVLNDGKTESQEFEMCRTQDGWEIS